MSQFSSSDLDGDINFDDDDSDDLLCDGNDSMTSTSFQVHTDAIRKNFTQDNTPQNNNA